MDISTIINVVTMQRRRYYINLLMNIFAIMNVFAMQLISENEEISKWV